MSRKKRKFNKVVKAARQNKRLREQARYSNIVSGLSEGLTIKSIHYKTGLTEKNIRKIIKEHANEVTFLLLKLEGKKNEVGNR